MYRYFIADTIHVDIGGGTPETCAYTPTVEFEARSEVIIPLRYFWKEDFSRCVIRMSKEDSDIPYIADLLGKLNMEELQEHEVNMSLNENGKIR